MSMDIKWWEGGLTLHEVKAIEKIAEVFDKTTTEKQIVFDKKLTNFNDLKVLKSGSSMFPWKGYAGFKFVSGNTEGEFDLVIVTHYNVLIVELKHWNGKLTANGDNWFLNGEYIDRSAVSKTQNKQYLLTNKLKKCGRSFPSFKGYKFDTPKVDFLVVLTGTANASNLPEVDKLHTLTLKEFLLLADESNFDKRFKPHPEANKSLNQDITIFDSIFSEGQVVSKSLIVDGYEAIEQIFPSKDKESIYIEYFAKSKSNKNDQALLRKWNFSKLKDSASKTKDERYRIVSHEKEILTFIRQNNDELYNTCLRSLTNINPENITEEFYELFELPYEHLRFNEYIASYANKLSEEERLGLLKVLLNNFSDLHNLKIAHRDIGDHSLWFSPGKRIVLSSFMAAYHKPAGTVGERRGILSSGVIDLPEDNNTNYKGTEFERDIYVLGILSWLILQGRRLNIKSKEEALQSINNSTAWYIPLLQKAISTDPKSRFKAASEMLENLVEIQPKKEKIEIFNESILDPYKHKINLYKIYPEDDGIISSVSKEIYRSDSSLIKIWNNALNSNESTSIFSCKVFFDRVDKIQTLSINSIPTIREKGLTHKYELYLVQDFIYSNTWNDWTHGDLEEKQKIAAIKLLASEVSNLHENGITHGDLHPENLLIDNSGTDLKLYFIDLPDFQVNGYEPKNHKYSPENICSATPAERDNYAVMRMACELLEIDWEAPNEHPLYNNLIKAIQVEQSDSNGFISLDRFMQALDNQSSLNNKYSEITVELANITEPITLYPDNGELFVFIDCDAENTKQNKILLSGINASWTIFFNPSVNSITNFFRPKEIENISPWIVSNSQLTIPLKINLIPSKYNNTSTLLQYLLGYEAFLIDCRVLLDKNNLNDINEKSIKVTDEQQKDHFLFKNNELENLPILQEIKINKVSTRNIWKSILETEIEALPSIEVSSEPRLDSRRNELIISYDSDKEVLEQFEDDDVFAIKKVDEKEFTLGKVNINLSTSKEIRLSKYSEKSRIDKEDIIYLRSKKDKASYTRRKSAMERILNKNSVIPDLANYFDPHKNQDYIDYKDVPTEEQLDLYNQYDDNGNLKISLNEAQRDAFRTLYSKGPLSLLQGPPGTGKTEFISAFVHYLLSAGGAHNILLVSQSHEAVNTAIERIRKHCVRLNTPVDIVRFSNSEASVSEDLKDIYSKNLIESTRQLFIAELKERIQYVQPSLKLESSYLEAVISSELGIKRKVKNALRIQLDITVEKDDNLRNSLCRTLDSLKSQINEELINDFSIELDELHLNELNAKIDAQLNNLYSIGPHEYKRVRSLIDLVMDYKDRLSSNPNSYEEFLARSRTLVCGTCVGMGLKHLGLNQIQYDWVIIDEAARSISSELAIAMQSAKRILLVGDHKQLKPLFQDEHKNAILRKLELPKVEPFLSEIFNSDFERAFLSSYGRSVGKTLLTQYRMAEPIGRLVSDVFYDQNLLTGDRDFHSFYNNTNIEALRAPVTWLDTSSNNSAYHEEEGTSLINLEEVEQIIHILKEIESNNTFIKELSKLTSPNEPAIGIICMYAAQKRLMRRKFNEQAWDSEFKELIKIDTVDSYQGKENRIIIVSITLNGKDKKTGRNPRFLREPNRINVALSRAMDRLLIVGAIKMWNRENSSYPLGRVAAYMQKNQNNNYCILPAKKLSNMRGKK